MEGIKTVIENQLSIATYRGYQERYALYCIATDRKLDDKSMMHEFTIWINEKWRQFKQHKNVSGYVDPRTEEFNQWLKDEIWETKAQFYCWDCNTYVYTVKDQVTENNVCGLCYGASISKAKGVQKCKN